MLASILQLREDAAGTAAERPAGRGRYAAPASRRRRRDLARDRRRPFGPRIASNEKADELDPDFVSLVVRKPYEVQTLTGILLSAVIQIPGSAARQSDSTSAD